MKKEKGKVFPPNRSTNSKACRRHSCPQQLPSRFSQAPPAKRFSALAALSHRIVGVFNQIVNAQSPCSELAECAADRQYCLPWRAADLPRACFKIPARGPRVAASVRKPIPKRSRPTSKRITAALLISLRKSRTKKNRFARAAARKPLNPSTKKAGLRRGSASRNWSIPAHNFLSLAFLLLTKCMRNGAAPPRREPSLASRKFADGRSCSSPMTPP